MKSEGILDPEKIKLTAVVTPPTPAPETLPKLEDVLKLTGDPAKGAAQAQRCLMCHQIDGQGVDFGPGLSGWGASQPTEVIAEAIINPSKDIAHGFEGWSVTTKDGIQIDGLLLSDGDFVMMKSMGGQTQIIAKEKIKSKRRMDRSLMLSGPTLGLTPQDIADLVAWMRQAKR